MYLKKTCTLICSKLLGSEWAFGITQNTDIQVTGFYRLSIDLDKMWWCNLETYLKKFEENEFTKALLA
jgi:hypothetical protein